MSYFQKLKALLIAYKWIAVASLAAIIAVVSYAIWSGSNAVQDPEAALRRVEVVSVADYARGALGVAVPTANGNSYVIRSEAGGKVTRAARTGAVARGAIVVQLENSSQRAALTQAEGAYDAALAGAGGNETSQQTARQDAVRTWTSATVSSAETVRTSIDGYFADIRSTGGATGFKLEAFGAAAEFNQSRSAIEARFDAWEKEQVNEQNAAEKLAQLSNDLGLIGGLIDRIAALVPRQDVSSVYTEEDRIADATNLATARATITALEESTAGALTAMTSASGSGDAAAQAHVKQALGALQAAQALFDKTIIRAPFDGTLSAVNVASGDIISVGGDAAIIVPSEGVETERSFSLPLSAVKYTPAGAFVFLVNAEGSLESREVETGLVTASSITVTGLNGDEAIVKDVRGLKTGEKVSVEGQ